MHETKERVKKLCGLKEKLFCAVDCELTKPFNQVNTMELGAAIDMIKDLAETEEKCWESCYYKYMVEDMYEEREDSSKHMMGYNTRRYASGRYAPAGKGHISGYLPPIYDENLVENLKMGYDPEYAFSRDTGIMHNPKRESQRGMTYDEYEKAKRHYTETRSMSDKDEMEHKAMKHVTASVATFRDIWKDADPELKKDMKRELTSLLSDMTN